MSTTEGWDGFTAYAGSSQQGALPVELLPCCSGSFVSSLELGNMNKRLKQCSLLGMYHFQKTITKGIPNATN